MVPGRSKQVFKTWLASRPDTWRERIEIVAMDGFTGFKSAAAEELPGARAVMDPFHVVHLAGNALDECRRRIQQELHHRRGRATDPLYKARRMLHTRSCLLTPRQQHQILDLFASDYHVALEVTWSVYQNIIDAYRAPDTDVGKALMQAEINTLTSTRVPRGLTELITLGRTLKRRAGDILAYFDHPHTSNGPTEAINGRLEHLRGSALGLAKPHQLHHPSTPRNRRIQTPTTPPIMKSRKSGHCTDDDCGAPGELRAELWVRTRPGPDPPPHRAVSEWPSPGLVSERVRSGVSLRRGRAVALRVRLALQLRTRRRGRGRRRLQVRAAQLRNQAHAVVDQQS